MPGSSPRLLLSATLGALALGVPGCAEPPGLQDPGTATTEPPSPQPKAAPPARERGSVEAALNAMPPGFRARARAGGDIGAFGIQAVWSTPDGSRAWAVGEMGTVLHVDDQGPWRVDQRGSALSRRTLTAVAFDAHATKGLAGGEGPTLLAYRDGAWTKTDRPPPFEPSQLAMAPDGEWAIAVGTVLTPAPAFREPKCLSSIWRAGTWSDPAECGARWTEGARLQIVEDTAWLSLTSRCPDERDYPYEGPHLLKWASTSWSELAVCEPHKSAKLTPATPAAPYLTFAGGGLARRGPDGRLELDADGYLRSIIESEGLGSIETSDVTGLQLEVVAEDQSARRNPDDSQVMTRYELKLSVDHRATGPQIETLMRYAMEQVSTPEARVAYDHLALNLRLAAADASIASIHWQPDQDPQFKLKGQDGPLQTRAEALLLADVPFERAGMGWSGCPAQHVNTKIVARADHLLVTYQTDSADPPLRECVFAIAQKALSHIYGLSMLTVRLEVDNEPTIEMDFDPALFFQIDPYVQYLGREYDLHEAVETHHDNKRARDEARAKIDERWRHDVAWRFDPSAIRHYRGWDRPAQ